MMARALLTALCTGLITCLFAHPAACQRATDTTRSMARRDFHIESEPGISLFVREVKLASPLRGDAIPLVLVHGARVPGLASFDLPVPNGSLAEDLARAGYPVYIMDVRGYGYSTRPPEMSQPRHANAPLIRSTEALSDIAAVVDWVRTHRGVEKVALLGWATGGSWCGNYAALHPDRVRDVIFLNTLYGGSDTHPSIGHGSSLEDPEHPGRFNAGDVGAYRFNTAESLFGSWDRSIPIDDKAAWRDPEIAAAYATAALESDSTSGERTPPSFRAPAGALEDSFYQAIGRRLWDASAIRSRALILRSELDFWSREADQRTLQQELVHAREVRSVTIPGATHYVFLDRSEHGRTRLIREVLDFLGAG
ncbi:MAG TPA: alpha/beta hydrolase [Gemmatimonadaceae bacterium]|nr:alpha/beta hydrolase [Gemmatimonadaceae bacterium]